MPRGGFREGSGRPAGSKNKRKRNVVEEARKIIAAAERDGEAPLNYMLRIMNDPTAPEHRRDMMARCAAPFCHARLISAKHDVHAESVESTNVYVEQISVIAVESGKFLTADEASAPVVEVLPDPPQLEASVLARELLELDDEEGPATRLKLSQRG